MRLTHSEVGLWLIELAGLAAPLQAQLAVLDEGERQRASRMVAPAARLFISSHYALRTILGALCATAPTHLRFSDTPGRPELRYPASDYRFSLSHSGTYALVGVAAGRAIGVDIEQTRALDDIDGLAQRLLDADDLPQWAATPPAQRADAFFSWWARREAALKALGLGLLASPGSAPTPLDERRTEIQGRLASGEALPLTVRRLSLAPGYTAALAIGEPRQPADLLVMCELPASRP